MAIDNDQVQRLADLMRGSVDAYEKGARINDSMTMEEAKWLNFGRHMAEGLARAKPVDPKVIDAKNHFGGDRP